MNILQTERLTLRTFTINDAPFYMALVNEPAWVRFIGNRNLTNIEDTRAAILKGPLAMQERFGFSLYVVERIADAVPLGICGLIKRDSLDDVDLGFAYLKAYRGQGYALEAASATMDYAKNTIGLKRIVAITSPDNFNSIKLLEKIGFAFERVMMNANNEPDTKLFAHAFV
jgi:RimJ/RimL family protein N-acetyltransferase